MRKIIVLSFISLDGVIQAPGRPDEDKSGGFKYGGWVAPYNDEVSNKVMKKLMKPSDILLGRKTFEIFASYWPTHEKNWPGIKEVSKYVLSKTIKKSDPLVVGWNKSEVLRTLADIKKLKSNPDSFRKPYSKSSDIKVWGSSQLVQLLLKHDLVDELWLIIHPVILGSGKKLFHNGNIPATAFKLKENKVTSNGVIIANYKRAGKVKTGVIGG